MRPTLHPLAAAIAALLGPGFASAQFVAPTTLPSTPTLRAGSATVVTSGAAATQTITQSSARAAIDWATFSIGKNAQVVVNQPSAQSVLLNRAVGAPGITGPSYIEGALSANGRVFVLNTAGVLFGADARVNVGGLLASTLDLVNGNTAAGMTAFLTGASIDLFGTANATAAVIVLPASSAQPQIQAGPGGEVLLIGNARLTANNSQSNLPGITTAAVPLLGSVTHAGNIATQGGRVQLAAGETATVSLPVGNSGFVSLSLVGAAPRAVGVVTAPGSIITNPGGSVTLQSVSQATLGPFSGPGPFENNGSFGSPAGTAAVITGGSISARNETAQPSSSVNITSVGAATFLILSGSVDVTGSSAGASGGNINASGQYIRLQSVSTPETTSVMDASGAAGGGRITLGSSATRLLNIAETSQLRANATTTGDGGTVALDATYFNLPPSGPLEAGTNFGVASIGGRIEAVGRGSGHRGGTISTSGAALNIATSAIDASGLNGAAPGTWSVDPYDVSISNAASVAVTDFAPTAPGATIRAADIGAALDTGSNVRISTGSGGPQFSGTITVESDVTVARSAGTAPVALTLSAANAVVMRRGARIASSAGPLDVNLFADSDGNGSGGVRLSEGGASIVTRGGSVVFSGGIDPVTGLAGGNAVYDAGVDVIDAILDLRGPASAGNLTMRGVGYIGSGYDTPGVRIAGGTIDANNIALLGRSGNSNGVQIGAGTRLATAAGTIDVRGSADPGSSIASTTSIGVDVASGAQLLIGSGSLRLAGRGGAVGTRLADVLVASTDNAGASVAIAGESTASPRAGIELVGTSTGLQIRGSSAANAFTGAEVVVGAKAGAGAADAISLGSIAAPRILTRGHLGLRPLGVDANGAFVEDVATPIFIGNVANFATSPATNFIVRSNWLAPVVGAGAGSTAEAGTVIGSSLARGRITVDNAAPLGAASLKLSLQNEGTGSAGIALGANLAAAQLGLLTTGSVNQSAPLTVSQLVVRGGATSTVDLANAGNRIAAVAFDPPASLTVRTQGDLTVGGAAAPAFDAGSGAFATLAPAASQAGARLLLQSLDGNLVLGQPITMLGANSQLDLVAAARFQNPSASTLTNGAGGAWHVWSDTWQGSARGGLAGSAPAANLYGCAFGDTSACSLSGVAIPTGGNRFYYRSRPTLAITADSQTLIYGQSIPPLTYATSGLVNGDTAALVVSGAPSTLATPTSPPQRFAIERGSLAAGNGYLLAFTPGTLDVGAPTVTATGLPGQFDFRSFAQSQRSDLYGVNFSLPNVCTASSTLRDPVDPEGRGAPPLAIEWSRLRNQPQLTSCLNLRDAGDCAAF